ncbi:hypothetical protein GCM10009839_01690 [Catenulispora yoronensis]|uniref:Flagellar FliJ protein n=1 Tax=Catenulispora yoronensis TaxID=450799 RepID=A0ABP5F321_9ACTN
MGWWQDRARKAAYARLTAQVADREAVRAAEEVLGAAWMRQLTQAEQEIAGEQKIFTHMRDTAYDVYRASGGTPGGENTGETYQRLAVSQQDLQRIRDRRSTLERFAANERASWASAVSARALEAVEDQEQLGEAERAARSRS